MNLTERVLFTPIQGTEQKISSADVSEGRLYFATDTGRMYLDANEKRISIGGAGASIYYCDVQPVENKNTLLFHLAITGLENKNDKPKANDIILNTYDKAFYRIQRITSTEFICTRLAISGTGDGSTSGGGTGERRPDIIYSNKLGTTTLINGQDFSVYITAISVNRPDNGKPYDNKLTVHWKLIDTLDGSVYKNGQTDVDNNVETEIQLGNYLRESTTTKIELYATGGNHQKESQTVGEDVSLSALYLALPSTFSPLKVYDEPSNITFTCNAYGEMDRTIIFYFDNVELDRQDLTSSSSVECISKPVPLEKATHGSHSVRIELWQRYANGQLGLPTEEPVAFEIAIADGISEKPIIWLGEYKSKYYNYDSILIPYAIYNPTNTTSTIVLKKDNIRIGEALEDIPNTNEKFEIWEIADATVEQMNFYQIGCGEETSKNYVQREISFKVDKDPDRNVEPVQGYTLFFNPKGRTNNASATERETWEQEISKGSEKITVKGIFDKFNWRNNGWRMDKNNNTFLRVSNGAKFIIPLGKMIFAGGSQSEQSHTIEMQLKIHNNQTYSNLVSNITRYEYPTEQKEDGTWSYAKDGPLYDLFVADKTYVNYDKFLLDYFVKQGTPYKYDLLKFDYVQKDVDISKAVCKYCTGSGNSTVGIAVGTQDALFSNGLQTVNVSFVENDIINLTFVYADALRLLEIFINGVISGVSLSEATNFTIDSDLIFDSSLCDIDIYSIRIYDKELNINNIVHNFAVDRKDIEIFDHVNKYKMAIENSNLKEFQLSYKSIQDYNDKNPNNPTMPYIVFDTTAFKDNKLPWSKKTPRNIPIEFVNVPLDFAYTNGELEKLAREDGLISENESNKTKIQEGIKTYYKHHCPSWTSTLSEGDLVEINVQGTSSEFYPRRNFKVKTKIKDVQVWDKDEENDDGTTGAFIKDDVLNIYMHKGPYAEIYAKERKDIADNEKLYGNEECRLNDGWYMNNYTNGTDRWTFKVDYMESSGSYNAAFASMVANAYSKHPLQDYLKVITNKDKLGPDVKVKNSLLTDGVKWNDYRTSLLGFPVMAFQKKWGIDGKVEYLFIGFYRMLLDKGSDEVLGFKVDKKIRHNLCPILDAQGNPTTDKDGNTHKAMRDVAECWEFSTNNRGYCSYRDKYNRVKLSFKAPIEEGLKGFVDGTYAPAVTNDFEYRYHAEEDGLDALLNYKNLTAEEIKEVNDTYGTNIPVAQVGNINGPLIAQNLYVDVFSKNWEEVCQWIYSTNTSDVIAEYIYTKVEVGEALYTPNQYYVYAGLDENEQEVYELSQDDFNNDITYYIMETAADGKISYRPIKLVTDNKYVYAKNKFYQKNYGIYSIVSDDSFNSTAIYYENSPNEGFENKSDLLVAKAEGIFNPETVYYTYNDQAKVSPNSKTGAVQLVESPTAEDFDTYYVASPVTYLDKTYYYDTQEYRAAKFINELTDHFDPEYLATYFVMTEVFECYDSRGKNCMMATWGPQKEGGNYIWYPIFYDIDTQLGINNTGIPSFEYNVDVTDEGNFSTNDSILWNNFYSFFKNSFILDKYIQLRNCGIINRKNLNWYDLKNPPLESVEGIEKWYVFDTETHDSIACRGVRPLIATNLDEYFKYITITNNEAIDQGVAYIEGNSGDAVKDNGTYFYALQGDRSQSRRQFLTNRIEYIDSWLNQVNYARNGANRIRGRISANNIDGSITSDNWIEEEGSPYWTDKEFGTKAHEFDAEYWLKLTPVRSAYVTAGDDSENYESQKFDGTTPVTFVLEALKNGIKTSREYSEQLLYIYGLNQMRDIGDMSKLYWTEFYIDGQAPKLVKLQLGYDALDASGNKWYNREINAINLKAEMPLLKEANFSNITITSKSRSLDLLKSEKLENFRAVGSNIESVNFAGGVALNTLYLPKSFKALSLDGANLLTKVLDVNTAPVVTKNADGTLKATPGLYIDGFFSNDNCSLERLQLRGGALGYDSYKLLKQIYTNRPSQNIYLTMTNVEWCPYTKVVKGDIYESKYTYYVDNGHYGFEKYEHKDSITFMQLRDNGELYRDDKKTVVNIDDTGLNILKNFIASGNKQYYNYAGTNRPEITGLIYINNSSDLTEDYISKTLQPAFPGLTFFFANVEEAYSAKFVIYEKKDEVESLSYVPLVNEGLSIPSVQKMTNAQYEAIIEEGKIPRFNSPFELYNPKKDHYDFQGWSINHTGGNILTSKEQWDSSDDTKISADKINYIYYARFKKHEYKIRFRNLLEDTYGRYSDEQGRYELEEIPFGDSLKGDVLMPSASNTASFDIRNTFKGWTLNIDAARKVYAPGENLTNILVDVSGYPAIKDYDFYAVFQSESVYDKPTDPSYFDYDSSAGYTKIRLKPSIGANISGKITLPAKTPDGKLIEGIDLITCTYPVDNEGNENKNATPSVKIGTNITHVFFEKGSAYKYVEKYAFCNPARNTETNNYSLVGVYLPETITVIKESAFDYSTTIEEVTLNDNITEIQKRAFYCGFQNGKVKMISLPKNLVTLGEEAFQGQVTMSITTLPDGIVTIPKNCFYRCSNVGITVFGSGNSKLTTIGQDAFHFAGGEQIFDKLYFHRGVVTLEKNCFNSYGNRGQGPTALYTVNDPIALGWNAQNICGSGSGATINDWNGI